MISIAVHQNVIKLILSFINFPSLLLRSIKNLKTVWATELQGGDRVAFMYPPAVG
jgi:hypothetical protein